MSRSPYIVKDFADLIKLRILRWGDYSRLSAWAQHNHKGPFNAVVGDVTMEARDWNDAEKGPGAKECGEPLETGKGKETDSPQSLQKEQLC